MKTRTLSATFFVILTSLSSAQRLDDLIKEGGASLLKSALARHERQQLDKLTAQLNADQPEVEIRGTRVETTVSSHFYGTASESERKASHRILTAVKARPVWNDQELKQQADIRRDLRNDDEIDQEEMPGKNKLKPAKVTLETERKRFDKYSDLRLWLDSFRKGINLNLSRETQYSVLTHQYREKETGDVVAVYVVIGTASSADNFYANLAGGGFFGSSLGSSLNGDSYEDRIFRADMAANAKMMLLLKELKAI